MQTNYKQSPTHASHAKETRSRNSFKSGAFVPRTNQASRVLIRCKTKATSQSSMAAAGVSKSKHFDLKAKLQKRTHHMLEATAYGERPNQAGYQSSPGKIHHKALGAGGSLHSGFQPGDLVKLSKTFNMLTNSRMEANFINTSYVPIMLEGAQDGPDQNMSS